MGRNLLELLNEMKKKLEGLGANSDKTRRYIRSIGEISGLLNGLKVKKEFEEEYNALIDKAIELNQGENYRSIKKMENFIPRCYRFFYDNAYELGNMMRQLTYAFIGTGILFFIVSFPTYISMPLLPLIFIPPMYVGIRGIRRSSARSLTIGMSLVDFSVLTGIIGVFNVIFATKFNIFIVLYAVISIGLIAVAGYTIFIYRKYKKLFS